LQQSLKKLRVVTNRFRAQDGADKAAELLIHALRDPAAPSEWQQTPIFIYCGNKAAVAQLVSAERRVSAGDKVDEFIAFCTA